MTCMNPGCRRPLEDGARIVSLVRVDWGADDLRDDWEGDYRFCSFQCLAVWASGRAAAHDTRVVKDGAA